MLAACSVLPPTTVFPPRSRPPQLQLHSALPLRSVPRLLLTCSLRFSSLLLTRLSAIRLPRRAIHFKPHHLHIPQHIMPVMFLLLLPPSPPTPHTPHTQHSHISLCQTALPPATQAPRPTTLTLTRRAGTEGAEDNPHIHRRSPGRYPKRPGRGPPLFKV